MSTQRNGLQTPLSSPNPRRTPANPAFRPPTLRKTELIPSDDDEETDEEDIIPTGLEPDQYQEKGYYVEFKQCNCGPHPPFYLHRK